MEIPIILLAIFHFKYLIKLGKVCETYKGNNGEEGKCYGGFNTTDSSSSWWPGCFSPGVSQVTETHEPEERPHT